MNETVNALLSKTASENEQEKFAEDALAFGQLIGRGFLYEVFEKEGGAKMDALKKALSSFGGKLKAAPGAAGTKLKGAGQYIDQKALGLGEKTLGKVLKNKKPGNAAKRVLGYGLPAAGAVGAGGGYAAYKHHKKEKTASDNGVSADQLILRYED